MSDPLGAVVSTTTVALTLSTTLPATSRASSQTVFVPSTVLMQIDIGLEGYIPSVLGGLEGKPDTVPDETAILFWESQQTYRDGFKTLAVRTYTLTHGAVYTAASGAEAHGSTNVS